MKKELDNALVRDFPLLYRTREGGKDTLMHFGFDVGDGWEPLIRRLSEKLELLIMVLPKSDDEAPPYAVQVKEKFGTLRFYMSTETSEMTSAISEAEDESAVTCEQCGKPGTLCGNSWVRTLCEECDKSKK